MGEGERRRGRLPKKYLSQAALEKAKRQKKKKKKKRKNLYIPKYKERNLLLAMGYGMTLAWAKGNAAPPGQAKHEGAPLAWSTGGRGKPPQSFDTRGGHGVRDL